MNQLRVLSIQFNKASIEDRQEVVFQGDDLQISYQNFKKCNPNIAEFVFVSTCNRSDIYYYTQSNVDEQIIIQDLFYWIEQNFKIDIAKLKKISNTYQHSDAFKFLLKVCSGMDSMLIGESQIFGQIKQAVNQAKQYQSLGPRLQSVFNLIYHFAKRIRAETTISQNGLSIAYGVILVAKQIFEDLSNLKIVLIGAGDIMHSLCYYLVSNKIKNTTILNRSVENAKKLAQMFYFEYGGIEEIEQQIQDADIVVSSTASNDYMINLAMLNKSQNLNRFLLLVDLAVPKDIDPKIDSLEQVYLYNIDDLQKIIDSNLNKKKEALEEAKQIIDFAVSEFEYQQFSHYKTNALKNYRLELDRFKEQKANQIIKGLNNEDVKINPKINQLINQTLSEVINFLSYETFLELKTRMKSVAIESKNSPVSKESLAKIIKTTPYKRLKQKNKKNH